MFMTFVRSIFMSISDFANFQIMPIITKFNLIKDELTPTSSLYTKAKMENRDMAIRASKYDGSIDESIHETLGAVSIQIAMMR